MIESVNGVIGDGGLRCCAGPLRIVRRDGRRARQRLCRSAISVADWSTRSTTHLRIQVLVGLRRVSVTAESWGGPQRSRCDRC